MRQALNFNSFLLPILTSSVIFIACENSQTEKRNSQKKFFLTKTDSLLIELDSSTSNYTKAINIFYEKGQEYLAWYAPETNKIIVYNIESGQQLQRVQMQLEGPDGVGGNLGTQYINQDTIIATNLDLSFWYLLNSSGKVLYRYNAYKQNDRLPPVQPDVKTNTPVILIGNNLWSFGYAYIDGDKLESFNDFPCFFKLDLEKNNLRAAFNYPKEIYGQGLYGVGFLRYSYAYNSKEQKVIFSFPNSAQLYVYDLRTERTTKYAASSQYFTDVPPMKSGMDSGDFNTYTSFFVRSNSYGPIYYDPYRELYYRFAEKAVDDARFQEKKWWKFKSVIVLDKNFEKLGEFDVSEKVIAPMCFVGKKGFYMSENPKDKEDVAQFNIYTLQETK